MVQPVRKLVFLALATGLWAASSGCHVGAPPAPASEGPAQPLVRPDLPVSQPPFHDLRADWKQRLSQSYAYIEARGSYTQIGKLLEQVYGELAAQGLEADGPPFALYYDDPGRVPVSELRMRACFPLVPAAKVRAPLELDVLESTTVVYAFAGGPYPEVPRCYPALYRYLEQMAWQENGPIREIYLVNPAVVASWDELVTEVQIPATFGG